jgi:adenine-specific DNA-methyltransferase
VCEDLYPEIMANAAQLAEWRELYSVQDIEGCLTAAAYSEPPSVDFLRQNGGLVLDTRHFPQGFKERLIAGIEDLDGETDGLLVHGDNFQALNLIRNRYRGQIKCIYIDPPYNTEEDRAHGKFLFKDNFEHSTWCSMINEILISLRQLMSDFSALFISIDDVEVSLVRMICDEIFGAKNFEGHIHWRRRHNQPNDKTKMIGLVAEHVIGYSKNKIALRDRGVGKIDLTGVFSNPDDDARGDWASKPWKVGSDQKGSRYLIVTPSGRTLDEEWMGDESTYNELLTDNRIIFPRGGNGMPRKKYFKAEREEEGQCATNWWDSSAFGNNQEANDTMTGLFGQKNMFCNPKPVDLARGLIQLSNAMAGDIVLDFFAGSGTTGHAVLNLNRADGGRRKYILVEAGAYFGTVTLPRMKKVIYSPDWRGGKPTVRSAGVSHVMKYVAIESYEDALANIELSDGMHGLSEQLGDDYMLRYMLDAEAGDAMLRLDDFARPFDYKMKITQNNETKSVAVDLCETFNWLLGLVVVRQRAARCFRAAPDPNGAYGNAVRLEPDIGGEHCFREIEGRLPDGRRALVIWRAITDDPLQSNAALDAFFAKARANPADRAFDVVYANGDNGLEGLRRDGETWRVERIEPAFRAKMFEGAE